MKLLLILALIAVAQAQSAFEVATIKKADPNSSGGMRGGCHGIDSRYTPAEAASAPPLGRCVVRDARLGHMLFIAYHLHSMGLITGGPDWVKSGDDRFNIEAKVEDPTKATEVQLYEMLQALITERFSLKFHRETKQLPGFSMIVAKNGPRLKEAKGGEEVFAFGPNGKPRPSGLNEVTARGYTMAKLAEILSAFYKPVVDSTGLTGAYDFKLSWDEDAGPTLATALQEQLGLKLEPQKVPVSYVIVESAQKPSEN